MTNNNEVDLDDVVLHCSHFSMIQKPSVDLRIIPFLSMIPHLSMASSTLHLMKDLDTNSSISYMYI